MHTIHNIHVDIYTSIWTKSYTLPSNSTLFSPEVLCFQPTPGNSRKETSWSLCSNCLGCLAEMSYDSPVNGRFWTMVNCNKPKRIKTTSKIMFLHTSLTAKDIQVKPKAQSLYDTDVPTTWLAKKSLERSNSTCKI